MSADTKNYCYEGEKSFTLLKWKVRSGTQLFCNTVILIYKHNTDNNSEAKELLLKYKSTVVGTVLKLVAAEGDVINTGSCLLQFQPCSHPVIMKDLCAECGADLRDLDGEKFAKLTAATTFSMVHVVPELKVSLEQAEKLGRDDEDRLLQNRKLVLLVDLDQTLIHTTNDNIDPNSKDVYHFQLYGQYSPWYHTKFRPGTLKFLDNISKYYELHICTFGARLYAHKIAHLLDPDGKLFSHRILSRDECFDATSKTGNLKALFPRGDSMVCIIDDREDVWNFAPNVVHVKPYCFFRNTGDINAPPGFHVDPKPPPEEKPKTLQDGEEKTSVMPPTKEAPPGEVKEKKVDESPNDSSDADDYLLYLEEILTTIHQAYYDIYDQILDAKEQKKIPDLKTVVPYVRQKVLKDVNLVFSSLIPTNCEPENSRLWTLAVSLGAQVTRELNLTHDEACTTHVVASKLGTAKLNAAKRHGNIHTVSLDWLLCCAERWERADERLFPLRSSPEMVGTKSGCKRSMEGSKKGHKKVKSKEQQEQDAFSERVFAEAGLALSKEEIDDMDREVEEACSADDTDGSSVEDVNNDEENDDDDDESLSSDDYPRCWKKKRRKGNNADKIVEERTDSEGTNSSDAETIGSVDDEMAAAVEREFQSY